jgi:hypothetical protein
MATQSKAVSWLTGKATSVGELCLAGLTLPTAVWAGEHFTFSGPSAVVSFVSTEGCITTDVSVFASDESLHDPPGPPTPMSVANVMIDQFDNCTGATLLSAFGEATLTDQAFEVKSQLTSATLNATVQVTDSITGSTSKRRRGSDLEQHRGSFSANFAHTRPYAGPYFSKPLQRRLPRGSGFRQCLSWGG